MKDKDKKPKEDSIDTAEKMEHSEDMDDVIFEMDLGEGDINKAMDKLKKLKTELKKCQEERQEYLDGWQRAKADFINARKEEEENRQKMAGYAKEGILHDILPVVDSFDMAFANKEAWEKVDKNWRHGVEYIYSQLISVLEDNGMKALNPLGEEFDPNRHSSIESVEVDREEDDHRVMDVLQKGYTMNGKIVRAAKVKVGKFNK